ncbi:hypothetical protein ACFPM7_22360 [Actinokineospora guangxiensis]|uniref:DUF4878 domain-containing protein n=1 Tax=Actinokineospora guangxiensis TaxID=1490288 RepID=A0ABW0EV78_9PSEU
MTYPPQQPGPYGGPPPPGYGQGPWQPQGGYQGGFGTQPFPAQQPSEPPRGGGNTGKIVAIVLMALLVIGGTGVGVYFLTRESGNQAAPPNTPPPVTTTTEPATDTSSPAATTDEDPADTGPATVVEEYISAYETKRFSAVTGQACKAYKKKYGTNTAQLEDQLAQYTITGSAQGEPEIKGEVATARIALELTSDTDVKNVDIEIKIVKEDGEWRFCGEETA